MDQQGNPFAKAVYCSVACTLILLAAGLFSIIAALLPTSADVKTVNVSAPAAASVPVNVQWFPPNPSDIPNDDTGKLIRYGRELISHTAFYLGPKGTVSQTTNGMNCQNCHLDAGAKPFGNNYANVASSYPKFRARSGTIESVERRVNDCIERSLNGVALQESSQEMRAIKAYILWVGKDKKKEQTLRGAGLGELPLLDRAADPVKGERVFETHCLRCHGEQGRGRKLADSREWLYPPLAGDSSYNIGAGLYRLSRFATYVKYNMPDGTTFDKPVLTDEEAWDVAAYINSLPRPLKDLSTDWPDISGKPYDHPFGPYADSFSEKQHKYGPFAMIKESSRKGK